MRDQRPRGKSLAWIWRRVPSLDLEEGPRPRFWTRVPGLVLDEGPRPHIWAMVPGPGSGRGVPGPDRDEGPRPGSGRGSSPSTSPAAHGPERGPHTLRPASFLRSGTDCLGREGGAAPARQGLGKGSTTRSRRAPRLPTVHSTSSLGPPGRPHEAVSHTLHFTPEETERFKRRTFLASQTKPCLTVLPVPGPSQLPLTCTRWCRRRCGSRRPRGSTPCRGQSPSV